MKRKLSLSLVVLLVALGGGYATNTAQAKLASAASVCPGHVKGVYFYRSVTHKWEIKLGRTPTKSNFNASRIHSCKYVVWVAHTWQHRAATTRKEYVQYIIEIKRAQQAQGGLTGDWSCIHRYEGSWTANTGNGYYGGLQMDIGFQSTYGSEFLTRWGTADNWPVWAQVTAANRAKNGYGRVKARGYGPWPNTARACGLL